MTNKLRPTASLRVHTCRYKKRQTGNEGAGSSVNGEITAATKAPPTIATSAQIKRQAVASKMLEWLVLEQQSESLQQLLREPELAQGPSCHK